MGRTKKQTQHELRQTEQSTSLLLRQKHYDENPRKKIRLQIRLSRTCTIKPTYYIGRSASCSPSSCIQSRISILQYIWRARSICIHAWSSRIISVLFRNATKSLRSSLLGTTTSFSCCWCISQCYDTILLKNWSRV